MFVQKVIKGLLVSSLIVMLSAPIVGQDKEYGKGKIPAEYKKTSLKKLPIGAEIWDTEEALLALKGKKGKVLWVDTRPKSYYDVGTVKNAALLIYNKKGKLAKSNQMTKESLFAEMDKISKNRDEVIVAFYCQGPECHRSFNAALVAIKEYGLKKSQVVWFRKGYPALFEYMNDNPKWKRKMKKYLQGSEIQ